MTTEDDDILDALAGRPIARLPAWRRGEVRKTARRRLQERHAAELRQLEDDEARRILAQHPLW